MVEQIRTEGWTRETIQRACRVLTRAATTHGGEDGALAAEFVRWLRDACNVDLQGVVDTVNTWKPISPATPHLDDLYRLLVNEPADLVAALKERYPDPEAALMGMLDEVFPEGRDAKRGRRRDPGESEEREQAHRTAFAALLLLKTTRGTEYVLRRLRHFDWSDESLEETRETAFLSCAESLRSELLRLWPGMSWRQRKDAVAFLCAHQFHNDELLPLLTHVEFQTLPEKDLANYVRVLWHVQDRRTMSRVRAIFARALHELDAGRAEAMVIVELMFDLFGYKGPNQWLTDEQHQRIDVLLVPYKQVGPIEIRRERFCSDSWYAQGPVPLAVALELYEDVVGRRDLQPPPTGTHVAWYTADGVRVLPTDYEGVMPPEPMKRHDRPSDIASAFMPGYRIASRAGLQLFEAVLRKHGIDRAPAPSWWETLYHGDGN